MNKNFYRLEQIAEHNDLTEEVLITPWERRIMPTSCLMVSTPLWFYVCRPSICHTRCQVESFFPNRLSISPQHSVISSLLQRCNSIDFILYFAILQALQLGMDYSHLE